MRLSVNVNKVATLRNSRGGPTPSVVAATRVCIEAGARGITVHPRADRRHITPEDVQALAREFADPFAKDVEFNIEGDPTPEWLELVLSARPTQATLVPVVPGEITSHAGWRPNEHRRLLEEAITALRTAGVRVSLFVDAKEAPIEWARSLGADRVELYTEPYARAHEQGPTSAAESFALFCRAAEHAHALGLEVNAGHDLDLDNLRLFRRLPHLAEVSIGHALMSRALFVGLARCVGEYLDVLAEGGDGGLSSSATSR
jgi:pyridoxine 5-phosphate synthase